LGAEGLLKTWRLLPSEEGELNKNKFAGEGKRLSLSTRPEGVPPGREGAFCTIKNVKTSVGREKKGGRTRAGSDLGRKRRRGRKARTAYSTKLAPLQGRPGQKKTTFGVW